MVDERLIAGANEVLERLETSKSMIIDQHPDKEGETRIAIGYWAPKDRTSHLVHEINMMAMGGDDNQRRIKIAMKELALPNPLDFVDENWSLIEREKIAGYIDSQPAAYFYDGWSDCRLCEKSVGSRCLADTKYIFPEGFSHYILEHSVKPPKEFIEHVKVRIIETF